jgi:hypothetical protein
MATVTKDFKVKNGIKVQGDANIDGSLYVGGPNATVNGSDIITEDIITGGTQTNIAVTYDAVNKVVNFVAENGIADSTTDELDEGQNNLYFTDTRAIAAAAQGLNNGTHTNITVDYDGIANSISLTGAVTYTDEDARNAISGTGGVSYDPVLGEISVNRTTVDTWYDPAGAASTVAGDLTTHIADKSTHGVTGDIVGTSDTQTLTNKTIGDTLTFGMIGSIGSTDNDLTLSATGDILLNAAGSSYLQSVSAGNKIITQAELDAAVSGLSWKQAVNLFATSNIPLTGSSNSVAIDGHPALDAADTGYRLLLTAQTTAVENGIYVYTDNGTSYTLTRATDSDTTEELVGAAVFVMEGTNYANTSWVQNNHYETSFADLVWIQFSGQGEYVAGTGITLDGNIIKIDETTTATRTYAESVADAAEAAAVVTSNAYTDSAIVTAVNAIDTDDIEEGTTNLYFTNSRAVTALEAVTPNFVEIEYNSVAKQVAASAGAFATLPTIAYSFAKASYRSAEFLVKLAYGTHTELSKVVLTLDTSDNVAITEYAIVGTNGSLSLISADVVGSDVNLNVTPNSDATVIVVGTLLA